MFYLGMLLYLSLVKVSIQNCMDQFGWQDEVTNLKDQLQKLSSDVSLDSGQGIKRFKKGTSFAGFYAAKGTINNGFDG